jgi:hypothetical protein
LRYSLAAYPQVAADRPGHRRFLQLPVRVRPRGGLRYAAIDPIIARWRVGPQSLRRCPVDAWRPPGEHHAVQVSSLGDGEQPAGYVASHLLGILVPHRQIARDGSALGGVLGGAVGLRATLLVGAIGVLGALVLLFFSPVRNVHDPSDVAGHA